MLICAIEILNIKTLNINCVPGYFQHIKSNVYPVRYISDGKRCILTRLSKQPLKNMVSILNKEKDITSHQLLLIKQDRVFVN